MPKKKEQNKKILRAEDVNAYIAGAGTVVEQPVTETLENNFMPYAMSVIVSRAIPEIDGFKPSHRKLLYTMYNMGLLNGNLTKSANITGQTMQLNPHGDGAIYETMVRLTQGNEALLHPYIQSKGSFGKAYSRDMKYAASRYTEAKLHNFASEIFSDIDKDTVDFVDNYDSTKKEPILLPVTLPTILLNSTMGIAVGMASNICSFNLRELCETAIAYLRDSKCDLHETLIAPDFPGGGQLVYSKTQMDEIFETGRGSFKVRAKYEYDKSQNTIEIKQIPPTATIESIVEKTRDLVLSKKITEISDIRNLTDFHGMKITIDLKKGTDPDKIMAKLFRMTPLEDSFSCNFNILIGASPRVMGVREILEEWTAFRMECIRRRLCFLLSKATDKLHLLKALEKILLDIDKAIKIVRETQEERDVVPNLMIGFSIDEIQAEYVAEIKLRHLNREYILKRVEEKSKLVAEIEDLITTLESKAKMKGIIIDELKQNIKKYANERKTEVIYETNDEYFEIGTEIPDYPVHIFFTQQGYFKKITPQSLRMSGEHKLKEDDKIIYEKEGNNKDSLLFFSDKCQVYKAYANDFEDTKTSVLGDYIPSKLGFDDGEAAKFIAATDDYTGYMIFLFENGKIAKVDMKCYETKTNRKKLLAAYGDKSPLVNAIYIKEDCEIKLTSTNGRILLVHTGAIASKTTKSTQGVGAMTQRKGQKLLSTEIYEEGSMQNPHRHRTRSFPAAGSLPTTEEGSQLSF